MNEYLGCIQGSCTASFRGMFLYTLQNVPGQVRIQETLPTDSAAASFLCTRGSEPTGTNLSTTKQRIMGCSGTELYNQQCELDRPLNKFLRNALTCLKKKTGLYIHTHTHTHTYIALPFPHYVHYAQMK